LIFQIDSHFDRFPSLLAQKVEFSFHFRASSINPEPIRVRTDQLLQQVAFDIVEDGAPKATTAYLATSGVSGGAVRLLDR